MIWSSALWDIGDTPPCLHISRKDRKHRPENMFLSFPAMTLVVMITGIDLSQEIFAVNMLRTLKSSLKHRRKHVLRSLQLYGDQAINYLFIAKDFKIITA